ncbi:nitrate- and nitrite sensing domain-containing protein [Kitasatospora sp. NPDC057223]|uniref:nitrate- and nitrite sensing domain-containing protein n=1 Tax=Kitasatospora sp. NPDC057223 TaxID=3346055 RepID=UPI00363D84AB
MRSHRWSIRSKLIVLLMLPLVSLAALWVYAADLSLDNALVLSRENTITNHLARPLGGVVISIQEERRHALEEVATSPGAGPGASAAASGVRGSVLADLARSRAVTDAAIAAFRAETDKSSVRDNETSEVRLGIDNSRKALDGIGDLRRSIDAGQLTDSQVIAAYTMVNAAISEAFHAMTILPNQSAQGFGQALFTLVTGGDFLSQEDALISAAAVSPTQSLGPAAYSALVQDIGAQRYLSAVALSSLPPEQAAPLKALNAPGGPWSRVSAMEQQIIEAGPGAKSLPFPIAEWRAAYDAQTAVSDAQALADIDVIITHTRPPAQRALLALVLAGALGLVALIVSVLMSVRISRSLVGDLSRLRESARNLTDDRLRDVVGRLRRGEDVDVRGHLALPVFVNREMAQLGDSFHALQLTAVELAEEDVRLQRGISDVFVNLARRTQVLVYRQLSQLDAMERRENDPDALEELFKLDQLATRMRRYAEGLIIVSGAAAGRTWRHPVPAVDVVRGAIAETEDFARVVVPPVPTVGIVGHAVADVIHLLAELIENAQIFSPSDSQVRVNAGNAAGGLTVEIDDRGLGLPLDELAAANARISSFIDISALDSTRLGLVTVGRLAQRHNIGVTLRQSPYGGVTAVVLIPNTLLHRSPELEATPAQHRPDMPEGLPADGQAHLDPDGTGRHRDVAAHHLTAGPGGPAPSEVRRPDVNPATNRPGLPPPGHQHPLEDLPQAPVSPGLFALADPFRGAEPTAAQGARPDPGRTVPPVPTAPAAPSPGPGPQPQQHPQSLQPVAALDPLGTIDGLPRRVRQANLSPHLFDEAPDGGGKTAAAPVSQVQWGGGDKQRPATAVRQPAWTSRITPDRPDEWNAAPALPAPPRQVPPPRAATGLFATMTLGGGADTPTTSSQADSAGSAADPGGRPEKVRLMMSALQVGAARGRGTPGPDATAPAHSEHGGVPTSNQQHEHGRRSNR